jgi:hypothetical protein
MRQLSQWVSRQPLPSFFEDWLAAHESEIGADSAEQLATGYRLFDWTVRNIQLDDLMPYADDAAVAPAASGQAQEATLPAALRALTGPGYRFDPSQILLYGRGDMWQRMRIFTLLARQQGLDVVTLAFPGRTIPPRPRPWASALLLKDQLYLFDMRLGLPIPGKEPQGIATLQQVLDDPSLLSQLDIDDKNTYRVEKADLAEVSALLDVVAANLSQRMQHAEAQLAGDHRTLLTVSLTPLRERLRACRGIYDVYI